MGIGTDRLRVEIRHGDLAKLHLVGELDPATVDVFTAAVDEALTAGAVQLAVDLSGVSFVDSAGLRALISAHMRTDPEPLIVENAREFTLQLFTITRLDEQFTIRATDSG